MIKQYHPYYSPAHVEQLSAKQRGKLSVSREEKARQQSCAFIDGVGVRCGFPRRTIATAQTLYMRFHLFFPYKDFNYIQVALSTLYVSSKLHDTLKKPRDIILASYAIRFPHLVRKGVVEADPNMLEGERKTVLGIERLVLETLCFKFRVDVGLNMVVKLARALDTSKDLCQQAWRVAVDCHRSPAPLSFPPHIIALASLYTASILLDLKIEMLANPGPYETQYNVSWGQIDDVTHTLLDLYITILSMPISDFSPVSPQDPPTSQPTTTPITTAFRLPPQWTPQTLTELKIQLRNRRPGSAAPTVQTEIDSTGMGQNDGTVRFIWDA